MCIYWATLHAIHTHVTSILTITKTGLSPPYRGGNLLKTSTICILFFHGAYRNQFSYCQSSPQDRKNAVCFIHWYTPGNTWPVLTIPQQILFVTFRMLSPPCLWASLFSLQITLLAPTAPKLRAPLASSRRGQSHLNSKKSWTEILVQKSSSMVSTVSQSSGLQESSVLGIKMVKKVQFPEVRGAEHTGQASWPLCTSGSSSANRGDPTSWD